MNIRNAQIGHCCYAALLCADQGMSAWFVLCFFLLNVFIYFLSRRPAPAPELQSPAPKRAKASLLLGAGLFEKVGGQTQPNIKITLALLADTCKLRQSHFVVLFFTSVLLRRLIKFCLATETTLQGAVYLCCSLVAPRER